MTPLTEFIKIQIDKAENPVPVTETETGTPATFDRTGPVKVSPPNSMTELANFISSQVADGDPLAD